MSKTAPLIDAEAAQPAAAQNREPLIGDVAFLDNDPRYPGWHQWLPVSAQYALTYAIYATFVVWIGLYLACKLSPSTVDPEGKNYELIMWLPWLNLFFAVALLIGMLSKFDLPTKCAMFFTGLLFVLIGQWPRLAVPAFGGLMGMLLIYMNLVAIYGEGVVQWDKFSVPAYMAAMGPAIACVNMLLFKGWCYGHMPRIVYMVLTAFFMVSQTYTEYKKAVESKDTTAFDYRVSIPVYKRLLAFRVAVVTMGIGVGTIFAQEKLLGLLRDDVWACTPKSW